MVLAPSAIVGPRPLLAEAAGAAAADFLLAAARVSRVAAFPAVCCDALWLKLNADLGEGRSTVALKFADLLDVLTDVSPSLPPVPSEDLNKFLKKVLMLRPIVLRPGLSPEVVASPERGVRGESGKPVSPAGANVTELRAPVALGESEISTRATESEDLGDVQLDLRSAVMKLLASTWAGGGIRRKNNKLAADYQTFGLIHIHNSCVCRVMNLSMCHLV